MLLNQGISQYEINCADLTLKLSITVYREVLDDFICSLSNVTDLPNHRWVKTDFYPQKASTMCIACAIRVLFIALL